MQPPGSNWRPRRGYQEISYDRRSVREYEISHRVGPRTGEMCVQDCHEELLRLSHGENPSTLAHTSLLVYIYVRSTI